MTTFEHAMLGANAVLACGLHRKLGWRVVGLAGFAAIGPDWDGLTILWDTLLFDRGHRVWGHNVFACFLLASLMTFAQLKWDFLGAIASLIARWETFRPFRESVGTERKDASIKWYYLAVSYLAALSQIPADAVVSGGKGLSDWALKPLWPASDWSLVYSMVPWGNVGVTVIFAASMILMAKFTRFIQPLAAGSLVAVLAYIIIWGTFFRPAVA